MREHLGEKAGWQQEEERLREWRYARYCGMMGGAPSDLGSRQDVQQNRTRGFHQGEQN